MAKLKKCIQLLGMLGFLSGSASLITALNANAQMPPTSTDGFTGSAPPNVQANAAPVSPFNLANLRGGATSNGSVSGACAGVTCSVATCACTTFTGTLTGTGYGKVAAVIKITENDTDTTSNGGFGACFPAAGTATLTTLGLKPSVAVLGLSGSLCQFITATAFTVNGNFTYSQEAATGGTNKFATSFGTGNIGVMESVDQASGGSFPSAVSAVGTLQFKH